MLQIAIQPDKIAKLCERWFIAELAVFGSAIREDFRADSDVDFLVTFEEDANVSLFDFVNIIAELEAITGRSVDFVEKQAIKNPYRRQSILSNYEVIYESPKKPTSVGV